jgi:soluble lytic murein transglycosylase-like protein
MNAENRLIFEKYIENRQADNNLMSKLPLNVNLLLAIVKVESDYVVSAYNIASKDYGLMQINQWHVDRSRLDVGKLLTDVEYHLSQGVPILEWFLSKYELEEAVSRYNCGTRVGCIKWRSVVRYRNRVIYYYKLLNSLETK